MNKDPRKKFGERLRYLRISTHKSQEEFAAEANLHRTYIGAIERGERNVSLLNIIKLSRALHITPSELLKGIE